jgi:threonine aldolase
MGGGMRQAGILAAAGRYALANHVTRLADDHARARRLAEALAPFGVVELDRVQTNIVLVDLTKASIDAPGLAVGAREAGVAVSVLGPNLVRLIAHLDVDDDDIDRAIEVLAGLLRG